MAISKPANGQNLAALAGPPRRRGALLAGTALTGAFIAVIAGNPRSALAQCAITAAPNTVNCNTNTTTVDATNVNAAAPSSNARHQQFTAGGTVTGTIQAVTVDGFGLAITTTEAGAAINMTNNGTVSVDNGNVPSAGLNTAALLVRSAGGNVTYAGNGAVISNNANTAGLVVGSPGSGTATIGTSAARVTGTFTGSPAVEASTLNGDASVFLNGGAVTGTSLFGINVVTLGTGGAFVDTTGGTVISALGATAISAQASSGAASISSNAAVGTSGSRVNIGLRGRVLGGAGAVTVNQTGGTVFFDTAGINATNDGIGDVSVTTSGTGVLNGSAGTGIFASSTGAAGNVTVNLNSTGGMTGMARGVNARIDNAASAGLVSVNQTAGTIQTTGDAIQATSNGTGNVTVNLSGGQLGTSAATRVGGFGIAASQTGTAGDVVVTSNTIFSAGTGVSAFIEDTNSTGTIQVTTGGAIDAVNNFGIAAITNSANAASTVTVNAGHNITSFEVVVVGGGGLATVNQTAGAITSTGGIGINVFAGNGAGGVFVNATGGSILAPSSFGIDAAGAAFVATTGNVVVATAAAHTINSGSDGIRARMRNAGATGNVQVTANGTITAGLDGIEASTAATAATSTVTVNVGNNITAGSNAADFGVLASGINGLVSVNQTAGIIQSTGTGIAGNSTGAGGATVNQTGGQVGTSAATRVGGIGINATGSATNTGNITVNALTVFATTDGVRAQIAAGGTGNINVTIADNGTIRGGGNGIIANQLGAGNATIIVGNNAAVTGDGGTGIVLSGGLANTIQVNGNVSGVAGIQASSAALGGTTVDTTAVITGTGGIAMQFGAGTNLLSMTGPGAALVGNAVGAGNDTFRLAGAGANSLNVGQIGAGWILLDKTGSSTWTLTGTSTYAGPVTVSAGTLLVNGNLASASGLTVVAGATAGGTGTLPSTTIGAGGVLAPGNSIGVVNIAGNLVLGAGAVYRVEVSPTGADLTQVSGTAQLAGTAQIVFTPGAYTSRSYTILTSAGRTGTFDTVQTVDQPAALSASLAYTSTDVLLVTLVSGIALLPGLTPNQFGVARAQDAAFNGGLPSISALFGLSAVQLPGALDALSGEVHASTASVLADESLYARSAILGRLRQASYGGNTQMAALTAGGPQVAFADDPLPNPPLAEEGWVGALAYAKSPVVKAPLRAPAATSDIVFWAQGFGAWGRFNSDGNAATVRRDLAGFFTGIDMRVAGDGRVGIAAGYTGSRNNLTDRGAANVETAHIAGYGGWSFGAFNLRAGGDLAFHAIATDRTINFPGFFDRTFANYNGHSGQIFGELGYGFALANIAVEPFAGAAWVRLKTDAAAERGGAAALNFAGTTFETGYTTLGIRAASMVPVGHDMILIPRASLAWQHAFDTVTPGAVLAFQTAPAIPFTISGVPIARDSLLAEAGLDLAIGRNATVGVSYTGQIAGNVQDHGAKGKFSWKF
jgi:outer membrane autotransporter protein